MVDINVSSVTIGGRSYNKDKSGYPALPTVFSGVEIVWGAASCIDHPEPSRCTISLWVPKTHESFVPSLGEVVSVEAGVVDPWGPGGGQYAVSVFAGKVESVKLQDDHKENGGYRVNVIAADALAEAARLRLTSAPMPVEFVRTRQERIADLATKAGVAFNGGLTEAQGYIEALDTYVIARDIDSFSALELFQRTTMAAGHTVVSAMNVVQPGMSLNLPQVLLGAQPATGAVYGFDIAGSGRHTQITNGVLTRTNWASNASADGTATYYSAMAGTGGVANAVLSNYADYRKNGGRGIITRWTTGATGGTQGVSYKQAGITGASGSRVSAGMWVINSADRPVKLAVNLFSGATPAGSGLSTTYNLVSGRWTWIKLDGLTATAAYDTVEVAVQSQTNVTTGHWFIVDGVLIEKTATGGTYFDRYTLDASADVVVSERPGIPSFDASAIEDDVFELDTSKVVNEIKVEMKRSVFDISTMAVVAVDSDQIFTDEAGSRKTTPQTRSIATDWSIDDTYAEELLPTSVMATKGKLLLAGQSKPQWRMSSALSPVLDKVPAQETLHTLMRELDRFGALIKITNGPSFVSQYMRVRGGRIVLGESPAMEFDLEPVEYSAPIPLSGATLSADLVASNYKLRNFKTLTSNDLRTIGAR